MQTQLIATKKMQTQLIIMRITQLKNSFFLVK
jgi:hypothetical protein